MSDIHRYDYDKVWGMEKHELGDYVQYDDHAAIVAQLEADLAAAKKDQARYQKLIDSGNFSPADSALWGLNMATKFKYSKAELDAPIDAAIAAKEQK